MKWEKIEGTLCLVRMTGGFNIFHLKIVARRVLLKFRQCFTFHWFVRVFSLNNGWKLLKSTADDTKRLRRKLRTGSSYTDKFWKGKYTRYRVLQKLWHWLMKRMNWWLVCSTTFLWVSQSLWAVQSQFRLNK